MGTDIHLFIEYRPISYTGDVGGGAVRWTSFGKEYRLSRDYDVFRALAAVRSSEHETPYLPRGLPADEQNLSWEVIEKYGLIITPYNPGPGQISTTQIQELKEVGRTVTGFCTDSRIKNPDWHTTSWLDPDEFDHALRWAEDYTGEILPDYEAVLAAMRSLEASGMNVRAIFWFDG